MLAYLGFEIRRALRSVGFLFVLVALPVSLYLFYGRDQATMEGASFGAFYFVAMAGFTIIGSAMSATGPGLATERTTGWMRQLLVTPLSGRAWTAARVILGFILIAPGLIALTLAAVLYGQVRLSAGQWTALAFIFVLGALPFILIGLLIGLGLSARTGSAAHMLIFAGLTIVSGILVPWPTLPTAMQVVGQIFPLYHLAGLGWEVVGGAPVNAMHLVVLVAWTALLTSALLVLRRREIATSP